MFGAGDLEPLKPFEDWDFPFKPLYFVQLISSEKELVALFSLIFNSISYFTTDNKLQLQ